MPTEIGSWVAALSVDEWLDVAATVIGALAAAVAYVIRRRGQR